MTQPPDKRLLTEANADARYVIIPTTKPVVSGSRAGETTADASLRAALVALGLITDSTTA
jgi:hypothetical protein